MSEEVSENGEVQDQEELPSENEHVEPAPQSNAEMEALRGDMNRMLEAMNSRFGALEEKLAPKPSAPKKDELNEMLRTDPAAGIAAIVAQQNSSLKSEMRGDMERQQWDARVHQDFPTTNPEFQQEMQKVYNYATTMGLDKNDPRSLYLVAEMAAIRTGNTKGKQKVNKNYESAEPASGSGTPTKQRSGVSDNDPRLMSYKMTNPSPEKLKAFKQKLEARDKASRAR